ncbi:hypothetical protein [Bradyrhizobium sp.]|uniref:hypothetical protein n=1 Tax=Bradyrhizobium sp. TaxID=376 RepID=UPI003BAE9238
MLLIAALAVIWNLFGHERGSQLRRSGDQDYIEQAATQHSTPSDRGGEEQSLAGCSHLGHGSSAEFARLKFARVGPFIQMGRSIGSPCLAEQFVFICPRWEKRSLLAHIIRERGEPIL